MAFLTGSHVYGQPTAESDVDLVVLMTIDQEAQLREALDQPNGPVRSGSLNLIICRTEVQYASWRYATEALRPTGPHTRDEAVAFITEVCQAAGCEKFLRDPHSDKPVATELPPSPNRDEHDAKEAASWFDFLQQNK